MTIDSSTPLPQYITTLIQITVRKTIGRYRLTASDRDDIEQQIAMEVVRRRAKFDPNRAKENTFLARVVEHAVADILAARKAACRDYRREESILSQWLSVPSNFHPLKNEWTTRGELISEEDARRHRGREPSNPDEVRDLIIDMANVVAKLPDRLRNLFDYYKDLGSAHAVARATGMHHSSVCDALKKIKQHFETAGLEVYLSKPRKKPTDSGTRR